MIGVYDFCGHYEWTFAWLEREGGEMSTYTVNVERREEKDAPVASAGFAVLEIFLADPESGPRVDLPAPTERPLRRDEEPCRSPAKRSGDAPLEWLRHVNLRG